jgi:hypothetical protein
VYCGAESVDMSCVDSATTRWPDGRLAAAVTQSLSGYAVYQLLTAVCIAQPPQHHTPAIVFRYENEPTFAFSSIVNYRLS